jgi:hypothetical protein
MTLAGLGGLAIGLTVVADIGSLVILLPAFPFLAFLFVARRPQAAPMAVGLVAGVGYSVLSGSRLARAYLSALGPQLHAVGLAAAGFGVVTALIAPLALPAVRAWARRVVQWRMPIMGLSGKTLRVPVVSAVLEGLTVLVPVAVLVGFAIRPSVQITRGATDPYAIRFVASLQRLAGLPVDGRQQYYEQSLNWVIWYVGLPAVLLACLGAALLGRRCLRALLRWRGAAPAAQFWALPLLVIGWSTVAVLWDPATFPDQPWASRRLVPVVLPGLICLALWVCSRVRLRAAELDAGQVSVALVAACALLALAIPAAVTTFDPGFVGTSATATSVSSAPSSSPSAAASASPGSSSSFAGTLVTGGSQAAKHLAVRGMALKATYTGEQRAVATLCSAISPSASVIIVDSATVAFTQVVRGMCGMPTARMDGAPASAVQQVITDIERAGRRPVLLGSTSGAVALGGAAPRLIVSLKTTQDAEALTGPPATPWPVTYTVWMASPAAT